MQSGISASEDLHTAFATFTSDNSLFALPVTISNESLTPLPHIPFSSPANETFEASLPLLETHVHPRNPCYLLLRKVNGENDLVAVTYIPSIAPVRSKTLFASTRTTLIRELGIEKFSGGSLFCTDAHEVLDPKEWRDRDARSNGPADASILTQEERELQGVKRAEDEERHGTKGRDLMGAGEAIGGGGSVGVQMKTKSDCQTPMQELKQATESESSEGMFVHFSIDIPTESLEHVSSASDISPSDLSSRIPSDKPAYVFYQYPSTSTVIFIYTCPSSSKIKERMLYSSSRRSVLELARTEGVSVAKRLEADGPADITEARLMEEAGVQSKTEDAAGGRQGFARPKRPGKR